jgi:hypothetical protein
MDPYRKFLYEKIPIRRLGAGAFFVPPMYTYSAVLASAASLAAQTKLYFYIFI